MLRSQEAASREPLSLVIRFESVRKRPQCSGEDSLGDNIRATFARSRKLACEDSLGDNISATFARIREPGASASGN
jgi:hypothetical protein